MQVMDEIQDGVRIVRPEGRLDSTTSPAFEKQLLGGLEAAAAPLVLDFSGLDYISSAGLRVVLMAAKRVKAYNGKMVLCALKDNVREVFDISGFLKFLQVCDSREQALAEVGT
jgi:anti-anti-sigma factor